MKKQQVQEGSDKEDEKKSRVLAMILSKYSTRDLLCKFPEQIYYFKSPKQ